MKKNNRILTSLIGCSAFVLLGMSIIHSAHAEIKDTKTEQQTTLGKINGKITQVIDASGYTYAEVDTGKEKVWAAGPVTPLKVGDAVTFTTEMPMENFHSKSMNRDFPVIYFINKFITGKETATNMTGEATSAHGLTGQKQAIDAGKGINKVKGGKSIAEIYTDKTRLNGKTVQVRGKVTKVNSNIMGKNWFHIVDSSTTDDLTVTTTGKVAMGDVVVIEGKISIDKDYGYGYLYPVIVEDAKITRE